MVLQGMGKGDTLDHLKGMLVWHFWVGTELYRVNSVQYYESLPRADILAVIHRYERRRLADWLEAREKELERPLVQIAKTVYMGPPRKRGRPAFLEPEERERRKKENWQKQNARRQGRGNKRELPRWPKLIKSRFEPWIRPDGSRYYSIFPLSDHDYIEAMFRFYSRQGSRLLA